MNRKRMKSRKERRRNRKDLHRPLPERWKVRAQSTGEAEKIKEWCNANLLPGEKTLYNGVVEGNYIHSESVYKRGDFQRIAGAFGEIGYATITFDRFMAKVYPNIGKLKTHVDDLTLLVEVAGYKSEITRRLKNMLSSQIGETVFYLEEKQVNTLLKYAKEVETDIINQIFN